MIKTSQQQFIDSVFGVRDLADPSKLGQFDASAISAGVARVLAFPNASGTIALEGWVNDNFLALDGTHVMTGDLDMGNQNIVNPGTGHDAFTDFVGNEHIDHSGVNISSGGILSGGGAITASQTISLAQTDVDHNSISNTHASNIFSTLAVSGQSNVVADSDTDTLTLVAGTNITITTDAGADSVTINSSGGGGGALNDLSDVTITSVANDEILGYNSGWINRTLAEAGIQPLDAELTSLASLSYVSASFVKMTGANAFALRTIGETADDLEGTIVHDNLASVHQGVTTGDSPTFANLSLGTGELTAGSINRAADTLTLEIAGTPELSISTDLVAIANGLTVDTNTLVVDSVSHWVGVGGTPGRDLTVTSSSDNTYFQVTNAALGGGLGTGWEIVVNASGFTTFITREEGFAFTSAKAATFLCLNGPITFDTSAGTCIYKISNVTFALMRASATWGQLLWGMYDGFGNQFVFTNSANVSQNHDHAAGTDPTLYIHSDLRPNNSNNQWGSFHHDQEDFIIETGAATGTGVAPTTDRNAIVLKGTGGTILGVDGGATNYTQFSATGDIVQFGTAVATLNQLTMANGGELRFNDTGDSHHVGFKAPELTASQIWVLPDADGNANAVLTTDGGGNLEWTDPGFVYGASAVVCTAYLSTAQSVASGSDVQIDLDATLVNTGSKFDAGNNRITITDAGNYLISAQISFYDPPQDQIYVIRIKDKDGNVVAMSYDVRVHADINGFAISVCMAVAMPANDWLALYLYQVTTVDVTVKGDNIAFYSYPTYLSVVKI